MLRNISPQYDATSSATLGWLPVSYSTSPLGCSIRKDGTGTSMISLLPPAIRLDCGTTNTAPGIAHILFALPSAMVHPVRITVLAYNTAAARHKGGDSPCLCAVLS